MVVTDNRDSGPVLQNSCYSFRTGIATVFRLVS